MLPPGLPAAEAIEAARARQAAPSPAQAGPLEQDSQAGAPSLPGSTYTVVNTNDSGPGSLREAVNQSNLSPGRDQIVFSLSACPCTIVLLSELSVSDELNVAGPGRSLLTLSGNNANRVFSSPGVSPLRLSSMTLTNGRMVGSGGGAVYAGNLTLQDVTVRDSAADYGGGVYINVSLLLTDTIFENNQALTGPGGGAYSSGSLKGRNAVFEGNSAYTDGGGAYVGGTLTLTDGRFDSNFTVQVKSYAGGGGLMAIDQAVIHGTEFVNNTTPAWGGGAYLYDSTPGKLNLLTGVTFQGNQADWGGGGLFQWTGATLTGAVFRDNHSNTYWGGGLYAGYAGSYPIRIVGGRIEGNSATAGGGLYSDSSFTLQGVEVLSNTAANGRGGGAYTLLTAYVADSTFSYNTVITGGNGGGLFALEKAWITDTLFLRNQALDIRNGAGLGVGATTGVGSASLLRATFTENHAPGGYAGGLLSYGTTSLVDSVFTGNTCLADGGGAWVGGRLTLTGGRFEQNRTLANKGYGGGGGLFGWSGGTISGTEFFSNTSADWGGGAYLYSFLQDEYSQVSAAAFLSNTAANGGGGGLFSWFTTTLETVDFIANDASWFGGGLYAGYVGNYLLRLTGGRFEANSAYGGGGLFSDGAISVTDTGFYTNTARSAAGGGAWTIRSARVAGATFAGNTVLGAGNGGGLAVNANAWLSETTFRGNSLQAAGNGGGLDVAVNAWLTDTIFIGNQAQAGSGGGSGVGGSLSVLGGFYRGNQASDDGGGLVVYGLAALVETELYTNTAGDLGGGLAASSLASQDGFFHENYARAGGGAFGDLDVDLRGDRFLANRAGTIGGGLYAVAPSMDIRDAVFSENSAVEQGGGAVAAQAAITGTLFSGNSAGTRGGGLLLTGGVSPIYQTRFLGNQAAAGGGLAVEGSAGGSLVNSLLARNIAIGGSGQALFVSSAGSLQVQHTTIASPALASGSAVYLNAGSLSMQNTILANHAVGLARIGGSASLQNSLFFGNTSDIQGAGITQDGTVLGDPAFFAPPQDDYHLGFGSLADDAGLNLGLSRDFDGDARPQGGGVDIGYDEAVTPSGVDFVSTAPQLPGVAVTFTASAGFGQGVSFSWSFGDGGTATGQVATHAYAAPGVYPVTVTAANAAGQNVATKNVTIIPFEVFMPLLRK
jgi:predicted outer membrane repeat protein